MARVFRTVGFSLLLILLISSVLVSTEARPLIPLMQGIFEGEDGGFVDDLLLIGRKTSGPSPGGKGHGSEETYALGEIKDSGPAPGIGHAHVDNVH